MPCSSFYCYSCFLFLFAAALADQETICPFQSIYQLGDSLADTGNLIRVGNNGRTLPAANLPYGETFPGRPTGRWSNGLLIIDFFAAALHIPLLNPYLDRTASFEYGANFAVAGATALDPSFYEARGVLIPPTTSPLGVQLNWFQTFLNSTCQTPLECARKLRRALVLVGEIGGNEIDFALVQGKSIQEIRTYIPLINKAIIDAVGEVIRLGTAGIVVPGNFPTGCFPFVLTALQTDDAKDYDEFGCLVSVNELIQFQNDDLQKSLDMLRKEYPDVVIIYSDYYSALLSVLRRAPLLGFDQRSLLKDCCGIGGPYNHNPNRFCGSVGVPVCPNPDRYVFWDGLHLTQKAYQHVSEIIINNLLLNVRCIW